MAKTIQLTQGKFAIVNDEDYAYLIQWKWLYSNGYAARRRKTINGIRGSWIYMHNVVNPPKDGLENDHINRNPCDNRKENLRFCSHAENCRNQKKRQGTSSYFKGVSWFKDRKKWGSYISIDGKRKYLGFYINERDAAHVYDKAAKIYFKEFAHLNFSRNQGE